MASSTISPLNTATTGGSTSASQTLGAFRDADFLKIMLSELTNQDPFQPQETGKLVENVQKLQELANTTYQKFRSDLSWAQQLMGQTVSVQQQAISPEEKQALLDKGIHPDVGYQQVNGKVTSFRVIDQSVYLTIGEKDYPMDNVKQIVPDGQHSEYLATMANQLLGKDVAYRTDQGDLQHGAVTSVKYDKNGSLMLEVGGQAVQFSQVTQIGVSSTP